MNNSQQMAFYNERNKVTRLARFDAEVPDLNKNTTNSLINRDTTTHPGYTISVYRNRATPQTVELHGRRSVVYDGNEEPFDVGKLKSNVQNNPDVEISSSPEAMPHVFTALRNLLPAFDKILPKRRKGTSISHEIPIHEIITRQLQRGGSPQVHTVNINAEEPAGAAHHIFDKLNNFEGVKQGMSKMFGAIVLHHLLQSSEPNPLLDEVEAAHPIENNYSNNINVPLNDLKESSSDTLRKQAAVAHLVPHLERYLQHIFDTGKDHDLHKFLIEQHEGKPDLMNAFSAIIRGQ